MVWILYKITLLEKQPLASELATDFDENRSLNQLLNACFLVVNSHLTSCFCKDELDSILRDLNN
jgi:hypothetical protein